MKLRETIVGDESDLPDSAPMREDEVIGDEIARPKTGRRFLADVDELSFKRASAGYVVAANDPNTIVRIEFRLHT